METVRLRFRINAGFCLFCAALMLLLPIKWVIAWLIAMFVHEFSHYFALKLFGVPIHEITIGGGGAIIKTEPLNNGEEIIAALAGPAGGLILLCFSRWVPHIAICGAIQSAYNLIPLFPLDGGRAMLRLLQLIFHDGLGFAIYRVMKLIICVSLIILALLGHYFGFGIVPIIAVISVILKCSCKHD